jgi:predicted RNase H-like HicB family nuclease
MKSKYHINLFWSDEDKSWVADAPDLKSCSALGNTPEEALRELEVAVEAWLATAKQNKMPIPKPRYRPAIYAAE